MKKNATIEKRLAVASARREGALSLFHRAAVELEAAASVADDVAVVADNKRRHFESVTQAAESEAEAARKSATQIRSLIGS